MIMSSGIFMDPDQRVLVTGGASGIGRAIANRLIQNQAKVHVCDVSRQHLDDFEAQHPQHGSTLCDVAQETDVARLFEDVVSSLGGLDALINNAGIAGPTGGVEQIAVADWRRTIDIGLTSQFLCTRLSVPLLRASGGGCIINMSSCAGRFGYAMRSPYSAAKWGVIGFTQSLAKELGASNIRVNAILPGVIGGSRMKGVIADRSAATGVPVKAVERQYLDKISLRRMTDAEDVALTVLFLLSPAGRNISGQSLGIDGGLESL